MKLLHIYLITIFILYSYTRFISSHARGNLQRFIRTYPEVHGSYQRARGAGCPREQPQGKTDFLSRRARPQNRALTGGWRPRLGGMQPPRGRARGRSRWPGGEPGSPHRAHPRCLPSPYCIGAVGLSEAGEGWARRRHYARFEGVPGRAHAEEFQGLHHRGVGERNQEENCLTAPFGAGLQPAARRGSSQHASRGWARGRSDALSEITPHRAHKKARPHNTRARHRNQDPAYRRGRVAVDDHLAAPRRTGGHTRGLVAARGERVCR
jgi:hypothetical protein